MPFWQVDLTTRDGAENAAASGGLTCLIIAGLIAFGLMALFVLYDMGGGSIVIAGAGMVIAVIGIAVFVVAGLRLRMGHGAYWGGLAALVLALVTLLRVVSILVLTWRSSGSAIGMSSIIAIVVNLFLLTRVVNGVRGAWALKRDAFADDLVEVFN